MQSAPVQESVLFDPVKGAAALRLLAIDAIEASASGHPGLPLGMADVATVLWTEFLNIDGCPDWPDRDRFILSAGHGSMLLYGLLHLSGFDVSLDDLKNFRQFASKTPGHPEYGHTPGVETTTGPLGQGFANGVGMALGEALLRQEFGVDLVDHYTYVLAGDGCLMEGITSEAASLAGHLGLGRLIVLFDDNGITIDGSTDLATSEDHEKRFQAAGWHVVRADGHNVQSIRAALLAAKAETARPTLVMCKTTIGFGAPTKAGSAGIHGAPLGKDEATAARQALGFGDADPFQLPSALKDSWRDVMRRTAKSRQAWQARVSASPKGKSLIKRLQGAAGLPSDWRRAFEKAFEEIRGTGPLATRASSGQVIQALSAAVPGLLGGSADLAGSNNTKAPGMQVVKPFASMESTPTPGAQYIHYGVREHAMGAIMNGLTLHGGFTVYGGTFLVFSDYMRPAMRLAAMMDIPVTFVLTHDSIGLGEDGPTHQPVEHLESLRLMPNMLVMRPADATEVAECWMMAVQPRLRFGQKAEKEAAHPVLSLGKTAPVSMVLSRQKVPLLRQNMDLENTTARGAYILKTESTDLRVAIVATGSEVALAVQVQDALENQGIGARVISAPCLELFDQQTADYQKSVWGVDQDGVLRVSVEAGCTAGWKRRLGPGALCFGLDTFGASGKGPDLYAAFGLTANKITDRIRGALGV